MAARKGVPASERVQHEWLRRVEAEYRSAAIAQHLTLWLTQIGASPGNLASIASGPLSIGTIGTLDRRVTAGAGPGAGATAGAPFSLDLP